jgi:hypothetical protein
MIGVASHIPKFGDAHSPHSHPHLQIAGYMTLLLKNNSHFICKSFLSTESKFRLLSPKFAMKFLEKKSQQQNVD